MSDSSFIVGQAIFVMMPHDGRRHFLHTAGTDNACKVKGSSECHTSK